MNSDTVARGTIESTEDSESAGTATFEEMPLPAQLKQLFSDVLDMPKPIFAVVDGGRYGDLPRQLDHMGLSGRSLFLEHADVEVERAGGWLVPVDGKEDLYCLYSLSGEMDSMVFWSCPSGEDALHRHLRTINMVMIPSDAIPGYEPLPAKEDGVSLAASEESVLFRHWDPSVLVALLPLLDEAQFARLFGPASHIMMYAPDYGGSRSAPRPEALPIAPRGPLRIDPLQIAELQQVRSDASHMRIAQFLRDNDPQATAGVNDRELLQFVTASEKNGESFGLKDERAIGYWAWLMLNSESEIARRPFTREYLQGHPEDGTPDDKIYKLMDNLSDMTNKTAK